MSHLDFSEDDLIEVMSSISHTGSDVDSQSLVPTESPTRPSTPPPPTESISAVAEEMTEWRHLKFHFSRFVTVQVSRPLRSSAVILMLITSTGREYLVPRPSPLDGAF